jgi:hypothetical protein
LSELLLLPIKENIGGLVGSLLLILLLLLLLNDDDDDEEAEADLG